MKRIKTQTNINQLWQPLPETNQQLIRGGTLDEIETTDTTDTIAVHGYVKIKKLNSGG